MFSDVDESLRALLIADMPIQGGEVDIAFDRPTREWSSRLSKPTLNLFLFDVRERLEFRDSAPRRTTDSSGRVVTRRAPHRIDLTYVITAWTTEPGDEHRILSRALASMFRNVEAGADFLQGQLKHAEAPLIMRVLPPDHLAKAADLWGVLDNELHASLTWVVTAPLQVFEPVTGPMVRTRELRIGEVGRDGHETFWEVAGFVHQQGHADVVLAGVTVSVANTTQRVTTGADGRFSFSGMRAGQHTFRIELPEGGIREQIVTIPSPKYDLAI